MLVGGFDRVRVTVLVLVTAVGGGEEGTGVGDMEEELGRDDGYGGAGVLLLLEGVFSLGISV